MIDLMVNTFINSLILLTLSLHPVSDGLAANTPAAAPHPTAKALPGHVVSARPPEGAVDRCLMSCDAEALPTNRETCRLNCAAVHDPWPSPTTTDVDPGANGLELCLSSCVDASSPTNWATCQLNCSAAWSSLSAPGVACSSQAPAPAPTSTAFCDDPYAQLCEQRCFTDALQCESECVSLPDARPTDVATCQLRCSNAESVCRDRCVTGRPDATPVEEE